MPYSPCALVSTPPSEKRNLGVGGPTMPLSAWFASCAPLAIGMSHGGIEAVLSITVGLAVPCLAAVATYRPRYSCAPPLCLALLFVATVVVLRFNSAAFVIDAWTTLLMALTMIPRPRSTAARRSAATDVFADAGLDHCGLARPLSAQNGLLFSK
jgi:hypothetical protein